MYTLYLVHGVCYAHSKPVMHNVHYAHSTPLVHSVDYGCSMLCFINAFVCGGVAIATDMKRGLVLAKVMKSQVNLTPTGHSFLALLTIFMHFLSFYFFPSSEIRINIQ